MHWFDTITVPSPESLARNTHGFPDRRSTGRPWLHHGTTQCARLPGPVRAVTKTYPLSTISRDLTSGSSSTRPSIRNMRLSVDHILRPAPCRIRNPLQALVLGGHTRPHSTPLQTISALIPRGAMTRPPDVSTRPSVRTSTPRNLDILVVAVLTCPLTCRV